MASGKYSSELAHYDVEPLKPITVAAPQSRTTTAFQKVSITANLLTKPQTASHSIRSYEQRFSALKSKLNDRQHWPDELVRPDKYRKFYVASDLSYCGFGKSEKEIKKKR